MWIYENVPYLCEPIDILNLIRSKNLQRGKDILRNMKQLDGAIMFTCPWHNSGNERKPSCGLITVSRKNGIPAGKVHCFACGKLTTLEEFISNCFDEYDGGLFGAKWLKSNFQLASVSSRDIIDLSQLAKTNLSRTKTNTVEPAKYITEEELSSYRYYHPYMFQRKMTEDTIKMFDIGYDQNTQCITFPVQDEFGRVLFIARRSVNTKYFNYPSESVKPLYGLYQLKTYAPNVKEVLICESMINAITAWTYGRPALALNGTGSAQQMEQLLKLPYRKIVLGLDPDRAGFKGTLKIFDKLCNRKIFTRLIIPRGKDINDLSYEEFVSLPEVFISSRQLKTLMEM